MKSPASSSFAVAWFSRRSPAPRVAACVDRSPAQRMRRCPLPMPITIPDVDHYRYDFISHLADRFGLEAELVTERLGEWLLDVKHDNRAWQLELARR